MMNFISLGLLAVCLLCSGCGQEKIRSLASENRALRDSVDLLTNSVHSLEQGRAALKDVPENRYARAVSLADSGDYIEACSLFQSLVQAYPSSPLVGNAKSQIVNLSRVQARIAADRQAEERKQQAEALRLQRQEEAKYEPLSQNAAIAQWKKFRNHLELTGTVTTWKFKIYSRVTNPLGNISGCLGSFNDYPVMVIGRRNGTYLDAERAGEFPGVNENDWVVVTGEFAGVNSGGDVFLSPIRVENLGYSE